MSTTGLTTLHVTQREHVACITLNRPEKRNAMNPTMHEEMAEVLQHLNSDDHVRVIVITGAGSTFCAGADIKEYFQELERDPPRRARILRLAQHWMWELLAESPKATVCKINGPCFGGGLLVALACDIAIASDTAIFGLPEVNWGHVPGGAASLKTIEAMGYRAALYYAMTGENFNAMTAAQEGLISRVYAHDDLTAEVDALVERLAAKSPAALQAIKEIYRTAPKLGVHEIHDFVHAKIDQLRARDTEGHRNQGMEAFLSKQLRTTADSREEPKS